MVKDQRQRHKNVEIVFGGNSAACGSIYFMERLQCFNSGGGFRGMLAVRRTEDFLVINKTV